MGGRKIQNLLQYLFLIFQNLNIIDLLALIVSCIALYIAYSAHNTARSNLSLSAFMKVLEEFSSDKVRSARRQVLKNFSNYTLGEDDEGQNIKLWVKKGDQIEVREVRVEKLKDNGERRNKFECVAVRLDRIGFMFFELNLPKKLKKAYLKWMCVTISDHWNSLAPHIKLERKERGKYTPYFERLVYEAYPYYKKEKENAKILCLNDKCNIDP